MSDRADFLVELGTEELPPKALLALSESFRDGLVSRIEAAGLDEATVQALVHGNAERFLGLPAKGNAP